VNATWSSDPSRRIRLCVCEESSRDHNQRYKRKSCSDPTNSETTGDDEQRSTSVGDFATWTDTDLLHRILVDAGVVAAQAILTVSSPRHALLRMAAWRASGCPVEGFQPQPTLQIGNFQQAGVWLQNPLRRRSQSPDSQAPPGDADVGLNSASEVSVSTPSDARSRASRAPRGDRVRGGNQSGFPFGVRTRAVLK
jgi:hypothetical protein